MPIAQQSADHNACRDYINNKFQLYFGTENVYLHEFQSNDFRGLTNVIGFKRGNNLNEGIWVISAHYDSNNSNEANPLSQIISPGANDNGTGIAAILELARILSKQETGASVLFAAWDLEEVFTNGKATGSNTWFNEHVSKKKLTDWQNLRKGGRISQDDLVANINFDMFGHPNDFIDGKPVLWACYATNSDITFVDNYVNTINKYIPDIKTQSFGKLIYSDHYTFSSRKIPSVENLESGYQHDPFYHTYADNLQNASNINMQFACNVARGGLAFLLEKILKADKNQPKPTIHRLAINYAENPTEYLFDWPANSSSITISDCYGHLQPYSIQNGYLTFSPQKQGLYFVQIEINNQLTIGTIMLDKKERPINNRPFN